MGECVTLDGERVLAATVVRGVKNMAEVLKGVRSGTHQACFVKAAAVPELFVLGVASRQALALQQAGRMKTRNINTEILYALYPGRQIKSAFSLLGPTDSDTDIVIAVVAKEGEAQEQMNAILDVVEGTVSPVSDLPERFDHATIKQIYDVECDGRPVDDVVNDVVTKLALKHLQK